MGHSTGCQDTVRCVERMGPQEHPFLIGVILQAPVRHSSVDASDCDDMAAAGSQ